MNGPLLIPSGESARDTLVSALEKGKIPFDKVVVYKTIPDPYLEHSIKNVIQDHKISFIVCFSPSSVNASLPILRRNGVNLSSIEVQILYIYNKIYFIINLSANNFRFLDSIFS